MAGIEELHNMRTALVHVEVDVAFFKSQQSVPWPHSVTPPLGSMAMHSPACIDARTLRLPGGAPSWELNALPGFAYFNARRGGF